MVTMTFVGPAKKKQKALEAMASLGFVDSSDSIPWRDAFPEFKGNEAGTTLVGARGKEGLTQRALSEKTGIPQRFASDFGY